MADLADAADDGTDKAKPAKAPTLDDRTATLTETVDGKQVKSAQDYARAMNGAADPATIKLKIRDVNTGKQVEYYAQAVKRETGATELLPNERVPSGSNVARARQEGGGFGEPRRADLDKFYWKSDDFCLSKGISA